MASKRASNAPVQPHRAPIAHVFIYFNHGQFLDFSLNPRYIEVKRKPAVFRSHRQFLHPWSTYQQFYIQFLFELLDFAIAVSPPYPRSKRVSCTQSIQYVKTHRAHRWGQNSNDEHGTPSTSDLDGVMSI